MKAEVVKIAESIKDAYSEVADMNDWTALSASLVANVDKLNEERTALASSVDKLSEERTAELRALEAQLEALASQKAALQSKVESLTEDHAAIFSQKAELEGRLAKLDEEKISLASACLKLNGEKSALEAQLAKFDEEKISIKNLLIRRVLGRLMLGRQAIGFDSWRAFVTEARSIERVSETMRRVLLRLAHSQTARGLRQWREAARGLSLVHAYEARLEAQRLDVSERAEAEKAQLESRLAEAVASASSDKGELVARLSEVDADRARALAEAAAERAALEERLSKLRDESAAALSASEASRATLTSAHRESVMRRVLLRLVNASQARGLRQWRDATREHAWQQTHEARLLVERRRSQASARVQRVAFSFTSSVLKKGWNTWIGLVAKHKQLETVMRRFVLTVQFGYLRVLFKRWQGRSQLKARRAREYELGYRVLSRLFASAQQKRLLAAMRSWVGLAAALKRAEDAAADKSST